MCEDCGCSEALKQEQDNKHSDAHTHTHTHTHDGHTHTHTHTHADAHEGHTHPDEELGVHPKTRKIKLEQNVLARNIAAAGENQKWLKKHKVAALNLISSPGAGKTTLLEKTLERLSGKMECGVIVGDQQTDNDAQRLSGKGALVRQIETINSCHLDAERVGELMPEVLGENANLLIIENVGNLICPAAFDLGEDDKVVLLSITEGEDKPLKYPVVFSKAQVVVLSKVDLAPHLDWDRERCLGYLKQVSPGAKIFELSAKTGEGMEPWLDYLENLSQA